MTNCTPLEWLRNVLFCLLIVPAAASRGVEQTIPVDVTSPTTGTLVICGGGDVPDSVMLHFIELAGGPEARIVFIPTAAQGADQDEIDEDLEFFRQQQLASLTVFHTRSRDKANDPEFARPLSKATGVWLGGGSQSLLTDAYLGTTAEELIRWVLNRGGVVGGISAGAAVMSPLMIRGGDLEPEVGQGFGLLPGTVIDQHFLKRNRQDRLLRVLKSHPNLVGIGIDEGTALLVRGHHLTVMGDSDVVTCINAGDQGEAYVQRLRPGDEADLAVLIRAATLRLRTPIDASADRDRDVVIEPTIQPVEMPVHQPATRLATPAVAVPPKLAVTPGRKVWDRQTRRPAAAPMTAPGVVQRRTTSPLGTARGPSAAGQPGNGARPAATVRRLPAPRPLRPIWRSQPVRIRWVENSRGTPALAR